MKVNLFVWRAVVAAAVGAGLAGFHIGYDSQYNLLYLS